MKKSVVIFVLALVLVSVWTMLDSGNQASAISGCCKTRTTENDPWQKSGTDLESCKVENESDGDNVFKKSGNVWWDSAC